MYLGANFMRTATLLLALFSITSTVDDSKPALKLSEVAWLAGGWENDPEMKSAFDEFWQGPMNGSMVGTFRMSNPGRPALYEFLLLEEQADGVWMRIRHYGPEMTDKDEKPIRLKLSEGNDRRLVFTNSDNGKPIRITYERERTIGLKVIVETERESKPAVLTLKFVRTQSH
jgi:hypothetical protein